MCVRYTTTISFMSNMVDLPHNPSSVEQLHQKAIKQVKTFSNDLKHKTKAPLVHFIVKQRNYGSKVWLGFYSPEYCHCDEDTYPDGIYFIQSSTICVKSDIDLLHLEKFLAVQFDLWMLKTSKDNDDNSSYSG